MPSPATRVLFSFLFAVAAPAWADEVELLGTRASVEIACGDGAVDVGAAEWGWALLDGFHGLEADPEGTTFAWTGRSAAVAVVLPRPGVRRLAVRLQPVTGAQEVAATWDGLGLGTRRLAEGWQEVAWDLPETSGAGVHRLGLAVDLTHRVPPDPRDLGIRIDRVRTGGAGAVPCPGGPPPASAPASPVDLEPGEVLVLRVTPPPRPELQVRGGGPGGAELAVAVLVGDRSRPVRRVALGGASPAEATVSLEDCCEPDSVIALWPAGERAVRLEAVAIRGDWSAWRRACGFLPLEALLLLGYLGAAVLAATVGPEASRRRIWIDLAVVTVLALAVRAVFLAAYPEPGQTGDAWEYLERSRLLASGRASFLEDTRWHAWQTWIRPPGYYLFLAGVRKVPVDWQVLLPWAQAVLSALAAAAAYLLATPLAGRRAAMAVGVLFALYPELVLTFSRVLSEPLYMVLLVPALAALARVSVRPSLGWAAAAGVLFGLAAYVRSAPIFFMPLAALLLLAVHGRRRGWRPALVLVVAAAATVAPWSVRNSLLLGHPVGMDDLAVINLLQTSPDEEVLPTRGEDLDTREGYQRYYRSLQRANRDQALSRRGGEILRRGLLRMARHPVATAERFGANLWSFAGLHPVDSFTKILREPRTCRAWLFADLANGGYLLVLVLAVAGLPAGLRIRATWPILAWLVFNAVVINLVFHPEIKYRLPVFPVVLLFAGIAVARGAERLRVALERRRAPVS